MGSFCPICDEQFYYEWIYDQNPDAPPGWKDLLPKIEFSDSTTGDEIISYVSVCLRCAWKLYAKKLEGVPALREYETFDNSKEIHEYFKKLDSWFAK